MGRHYFSNFLEMRRTTCRKKFRNGAQKKVPESAGLAGRSRPRLGSPSHVLAQTRFPSRAQNIKNGPKWVQNRRFGLKIGPRESYGHFGPFLMFLARLGNLVWARTWPGEARRGLDLPARPADSGTFFWAPFRNFFLHEICRISRKLLK